MDLLPFTQQSGTVHSLVNSAQPGDRERLGLACLSGSEAAGAELGGDASALCPPPPRPTPLRATEAQRQSGARTVSQRNPDRNMKGSWAEQAAREGTAEIDLEKPPALEGAERSPQASPALPLPR